MRNASDARVLTSPVERERIAAAVTAAIVAWHRAERAG
jgi:N-acetylmuramoyl-L-alanine amidase